MYVLHIACSGREAGRKVSGECTGQMAAVLSSPCGAMTIAATGGKTLQSRRTETGGQRKADQTRAKRSMEPDKPQRRPHIVARGEDARENAREEERATQGTRDNHSTPGGQGV